MIDLAFNKTEYFLNRELSWLEFNSRVLAEAKDRKNPIFERLKFLSIVSSNLDEFFMIRVAALKDQVNADFHKPDPSGLTPKQQLRKISVKVHRLVKEQYNCFNKVLLPELKTQGIYILDKEELTEEQKEFLEAYFIDSIYPVLTPLAVDTSRSFPLILNKSLNIAVLLRDREDENNHIFATVQVPSLFSRIIEIPGKVKGKERYFILLEQLIQMYLDKLFAGSEIIESCFYRITRNADLSIEEEEAEDLLIEIEKSLIKRRWGAVIRLEVLESVGDLLIHRLKEALDIHEKELYYIKGPLDLSFLMKIYELEGYESLRYEKYCPKIPKDLLGETDIFEAIGHKDIFLHHPYESFEPVVEFIEKAAEDPKVLAIKQTLYRVSGDSPIVKALENAAYRGKQVMVLVEVKARFDEEKNIQWAKRLERAGCHVIYGLMGLKTHAKITLIVRQEEDKIKRYLHLGTGNYNDITAKYYTDMGLFTCNEDFGKDATDVFNMLSGYSTFQGFCKLISAPFQLRAHFFDLIEREIQHSQMGKPARIIAKMNSLSDYDTIMKLYKASSKGVKIDLIVRGICCLRPGIPQVSENITVRSIVGRFLEHSRIYYFYNDGQEDIYLSSADWMHRNLDRRIELSFPVENVHIKRRVIHSLEIMLKDTVKARVLNHRGRYTKLSFPKKKELNSQDYFIEQARLESIKHQEENEPSILKPIMSPAFDYNQEVALDNEIV